MTAPAVESALERSITLRPFREDDYARLTDLYLRHDYEFLGTTNFSEAMLRDDLNIVGFDPLTDIAIAELNDGTPVGFMNCYAIRPVPSRPVLFGYAAREVRTVLAPLLLAWGVQRAKQVFPRVPEHIRVVCEASVNNNDTVLRAALKNAGFETNRVQYTMLIRFDETALPEPALSDGFRIVSFAENSHIPTWAQTLKDSFADHRGSSDDMPLSHYIERYERDTESTDFDPSLWWLVMDGDIPAAIATTYADSDEFPNAGYVHQLGTVPQYRRRGIGLALLYHTFRTYQARGKSGVSLGVDGSSLTNAVALYERAGMHKAIQWDRYERELRPGIEITKQ